MDADANPGEYHKEQINSLLTVIKREWSGKPQSERKLYDEIASLGITSSDIELIVGEVVSFIPQLQYVKKLRAYLKETPKSTTPVFFATFLSALAHDHPELLRLIIETVDRSWRRIIVTSMQFELSRLESQRHSDQYRKKLKKELLREKGISLITTNLPKTELKEASYRVCELFRKYTGDPQHAIVGQLFFHARIEMANNIPNDERWNRLRKRIATRESRYRQQ